MALLGRIATLQNSRASVTGNAERAAADLLKLAAELEELERERVRVARAARGRPRARRTRRRRSPPSSPGPATPRTRAPRRRARAPRRPRREADALQSERDGLAGRRASLEEMVATHSAFDEGVRALLTRPEGLEVLGVVADALETGSEHERAVEAFLGDRLQAVLVPDAEQARRGIRWLQSSSAGRGAFLPLASARTRHDCGPLARDRAPGAEGARPALRLLPRGRPPRRPHPRLAPRRPRRRDPRGRARGGLAPGAGGAWSRSRARRCAGRWSRAAATSKGLLAPRREVKEVAARQEEIEGRLGALRAAAAEAHALATSAAAEARALEERIHAAEKDLVAVRHEIHTADEESGRLHRKASILDTERAQAEQERGAAAVRLAEIEQALGTAEAEREDGHRRLAELGAAVAAGRGAAEAAQARHAEARSSLAALRERAAAAENERRRLEGDLAELEQRIGAARAHAAETAARRGELEGEIAEVERLLAEALLERDRAQGETAVAEERVREARAEIEGREHGLKERRRERDVLRDALAEVDVERARTGSDLDHLARECQQAVGVAAAEAAASLSDEERARDMDALAALVQELRDRLERMGQVNVLAVEQAQELEERHTFLTAQRQDLLDSIAELDQAIRKIDRASRERFQEAFQIINQHFGEMFKQLFGGGTAGLSLLDEEDLLESGIDIMAQPPGKRLQNVLLLSGGEKALTAIALLFAIFQYKPSPFCILDEVDAPLDDANIGRFVGMLEGLKEQTQFVLITHSRKTMSIADQLYGVTMEEPGVSKLVSVRFT